MVCSARFQFTDYIPISVVLFYSSSAVADIICLAA